LFIVILKYANTHKAVRYEFVKNSGFELFLLN